MRTETRQSTRPLIVAPFLWFAVVAAALLLPACSALGVDPPSVETCDQAKAVLIQAQTVVDLVCSGEIQFDAARAAADPRLRGSTCGVVRLPAGRAQEVRFVSIDGLTLEQRGERRTRVVPAVGDSFVVFQPLSLVVDAVDRARCRT